MRRTVIVSIIVILSILAIQQWLVIGLFSHNVYSFFYPSEAKKHEERAAAAFLNGIDLDDGNYALVIAKPDEARVITDKTVLRANSNDITTLFDFTQYLPAERPAGYSLQLFRNGTEVKRDGVLREEKFIVPEKVWQAGTVVTSEEVSLPRDDYVKEIERLDKEPGVLWISKEPTKAPEIDLKFRINVPTIAIAAGHEFDSNSYSAKLKQRLSALIGTVGPFTIDVTAGQGTGRQFLTNGDDDDNTIRSTDDQSGYLGIDDFDMYFFYADLESNQAVFDYLQAHSADIENLVAADRNRDLVLAARARVVKDGKVNIPVEKVGISGYQDRVEIWDLQPVQYYAQYWRENH
ncbi:hypothetical protein GOZ83_07545 [Agrobacterium vitis]|uniref:hypothetical protein n=1 Tax=Rhizobium/Agrobacterium group TaxID=227290 RepID=UPI0012E879A9|nr:MULTISPECIES: hypothetical protein [Rhizobium/Agrobacterium group]MCF1447514.1 hypothetical protein [Allorhizobium ampelinum]MCF1493169.1 hypothetical protein [Allorhizobium ampelinum]MVA44931.1 hypothetical protein [Agrobacterium vitis]